jgi:hypothetical protein
LVDETDQPAGVIIAAFGGIRPMASKLGVPVSTVQGWKQRDTIPASRISEIRQVAAANGVDLSSMTIQSSESGDPILFEATASKASDEPTVSAKSPKTPVVSMADSGQAPVKSGGGAARLAALALVLALATAGWSWWTSVGPGSNGEENTRISALEGRVARLVDAPVNQIEDIGKGERAALAEDIARLRTALGDQVEPDLDQALAPLRAELAALSDKIEGFGTDGSGAPNMALVERLTRLKRELQTAADQATKNAARLSSDLTALQRRLGGLDARLDQSEGAGQGQDRAASDAIALTLVANQLRRAVERGEGYRDFLVTLGSVSGSDAVLAPVAAELMVHADTGVATRDALTFSFPQTAAGILESTSGNGESKLVDQMLDRARRVVRVRRVGTDAPEGSVDGQIARAEMSLASGDVAGALAALAVLDGAAAEAAQPWVTRAQAYIDMRAALGTIEARALDRLRAAGGA